MAGFGCPPRRAKPKLDGPDERPWWGGYELTFKLLKLGDYEHILKTAPGKLSTQALPVGSNQRRKLTVEISKSEFVDGKEEYEIDFFAIWVYTPAMVAAEKLRALCQQMPEYETSSPSRRARDFLDIHLAVTRAGVDLTSDENRELVRAMFAVKHVPLGLLGKVESQREFHRPDWPSVTASVPTRLEEYDFYFDFVLEQIETLKSLWDV